MPFQSLDVTLDPESDASLRDGWAALTQAGVRSEGERVSDSHRPHLTALAAAEFTAELLDQAARDIGALLPLELPVGASVVFGRGPFVVAHLLTPSAELREVVHRLRSSAGVTEPSWVPHLTLSRKVPIGQIGAALDVTARARPSIFIADALRHWDPRYRTVTTLATAHSTR